VRLEAWAGRPVGPFGLAWLERRPSAHAGRLYFRLGLEGEGAPSGPILWGVACTGGPRAPGWIDATYLGIAEFADGTTRSLADLSVEDALFALLGAEIPPNGWLALAYESFGRDAPLLRETRRLLARGVPPVVTPLGRLLHRAGCGWHIRDWYIAEGGREGPRKLQGFKPAHAESERRRREETVRALRRFLDAAGDDADLAAARAAAERILAAGTV
jgi:hypothetical protein